MYKPEKRQKIKSRFFLKTNKFSANQMISNDSKGINNRHVWLQYKAVTKHAFLRLPPKEMHLKDEIFLVGQGVPQMSQISGSCEIVSMSY